MGRKSLADIHEKKRKITNDPCYLALMANGNVGEFNGKNACEKYIYYIFYKVYIEKYTNCTVHIHTYIHYNVRDKEKDKQVRHGKWNERNHIKRR